MTDKYRKQYARACRQRLRWLRVLSWVRRRADAADKRAVTAYKRMWDEENADG